MIKRFLGVVSQIYWIFAYLTWHYIKCYFKPKFGDPKCLAVIGLLRGPPPAVWSEYKPDAALVSGKVGAGRMLTWQ